MKCPIRVWEIDRTHSNIGPDLRTLQNAIIVEALIGDRSIL